MEDTSIAEDLLTPRYLREDLRLVLGLVTVQAVSGKHLVGGTKRIGHSIDGCSPVSTVVCAHSSDCVGISAVGKIDFGPEPNDWVTLQCDNFK